MATTRDLALRLYATINEAIRTRDINALDAVVAPGLVDHSPSPGQLPGREGMKLAFAEFLPAFPDLVFTVEDVLIEGDRAAIRLTSLGTHLGPVGDVAPTGRVIRQHGIDILRFQDGLLVERWGEFDNLDFLQQLQGRAHA
ncbi:MAG: ester cyclase [Chloroflexi bacterium]|nr:ester cyclase [Chloroflexota bacterium]